MSQIPTAKFGSVVSIVAGAVGRSGTRDGVGTSAQFHSPLGMCRGSGSGDDSSLLITDMDSHRIRRFNPCPLGLVDCVKSVLALPIPVVPVVSIIIDYLPDNRVTTIAGITETPRDPDRIFAFPCAVCVDPFHPNCYFVGDATSIWHCDSTVSGEAGIALVVGSGNQIAGRTDGIGSGAQFQDVRALAVCVWNRSLYAIGVNSGLRRVELDSKQTHTIGFGADQNELVDPLKMVFDCSPHVKESEPALFITHPNAISRFDIKSNQFHTLPIDTDTHRLSPNGIECTPSGHLIVSCLFRGSIYLIDPSINQRAGGGGGSGSGSGGGGSGRGVRIECLARFGTADVPGSVAVAGMGLNCLVSEIVAVRYERCVYLVDHENHTIQRLTLSPDLFF